MGLVREERYTAHRSERVATEQIGVLFTLPSDGKILDFNHFPVVSTITHPKSP